MNNTLREIGEALKNASHILIFPHIMADGDTLGSAAALCRHLRKIGKEAYIFMEDKAPSNLGFLIEGLEVRELKALEGDPFGENNTYTSVCVDCGDENRLPNRLDAFYRGNPTICLDHHPTSKPVFDLNYIVPEVCATGEIVFDLLTEMEAPITGEIGEAIYVAIVTDTGQFQYTNTNAKSHEIAAQLYRNGVDAARLNVILYESVAMAKIQIEAEVLETMDIIGEGMGVIGTVTQEMFSKYGGNMEHANSIVSTMRSIDGVEIAVLLKEQKSGEVKATMRAKTSGDVSKIAKKYGGGGHVKAAGCSIDMKLEEVKKVMIEEVECQLEEIKNN